MDQIRKGTLACREHTPDFDNNSRRFHPGHSSAGVLGKVKRWKSRLFSAVLSAASPFYSSPLKSPGPGPPPFLDIPQLWSPHPLSTRGVFSADGMNWIIFSRLVTEPKNADDSEDQERPARAAERGSPNRHQGAPFLHGVGPWPLSKPLNKASSQEAFACYSLGCATRMSRRAPAAGGRAFSAACKEVDGTGSLLPLIIGKRSDPDFGSFLAVWP